VGAAVLANINTRSLSRLVSAFIHKDAGNTRQFGPSRSYPGNGSPGTLLCAALRYPTLAPELNSQRPASPAPKVPPSIIQKSVDFRHYQP